MTLRWGKANAHDRRGGCTGQRRVNGVRGNQVFWICRAKASISVEGAQLKCSASILRQRR